jgi:hypothetical protein
MPHSLSLHILKDMHHLCQRAEMADKLIVSQVYELAGVEYLHSYFHVLRADDSISYQHSIWLLTECNSKVTQKGF